MLRSPKENGKPKISTVSTIVTNGQVFVKCTINLDISPRIFKFYYGKCKISVYNQSLSEWKDLSFNMFSDIHGQHRALDSFSIFSEGEVLDYLNANRTFEFEVQMVVESILDIRNRIEIFNFYDPYPEEKMFSFCSDKQPKQLHTREQMIIFHSPVIKSFIDTGFRKMSVIRHFHYCELLLQLVHGTQLQLSYTQVRRLLPIANRYKVYSVVRKCEFRLLCLMENDASSETLQKYFNFALWHNLKTLWNVLLRRVTSLEELKVYTSRMNIETMPGEAMKKVAKHAKVWKQTIRPNFQSTARVSLSKNIRVAGRKWRSTVSTTVRSNGQICMEGMITFEDSIRLGIGFSGKCKISVYNQISSEWIRLSFKEFSEVAYLSGFALNFSLVLLEGEVLDYLNSNTKIEFEVQMVVERIVDRISNIQLFNFYDPYHEEKMFSFCSDKTPKQLHTREQMIIFHSPVIKSLIGSRFRRMSIVRHAHYCELLLQLVHGTQLQLSYTQVRRLLPIANRYKVYSVVRKCEFRLLCLMENDASSDTLQEYFNLALWYNLKTLWTVLLRRVTSLGELKVYTSQMNVETMPTEAMKKVAKRIFSFA